MEANQLTILEGIPIFEMENEKRKFVETSEGTSDLEPAKGEELLPLS